MSVTLKPISTALQRRAAELPCDGVKRYKVGKKEHLSYSEARKEILADSDLGSNDKGGRILKRGTAKRLGDLNLRYFRANPEFVNKWIKDAQDAQAKRVKDGAAPTPPDEIDDGGASGSEVCLRDLSS